MPPEKTMQYTIRGVPLEVDRALRSKAADRRISLNQLVIEELTHASGSAPLRQRRSLEGIVGSWEEDPEFDGAIEEQHRS